MPDVFLDVWDNCSYLEDKTLNHDLVYCVCHSKNEIFWCYLNWYQALQIWSQTLGLEIISRATCASIKLGSELGVGTKPTHTNRYLGYDSKKRGVALN